MNWVARNTFWLVIVGAGAAGGFGTWRAVRAPGVSSAARPAAPQPGLFRDRALALPPAGGLRGTVSREELRRVFWFTQPRWRMSKTANILHALRLWGGDATFSHDAPLGEGRATIADSRRMLTVMLDMKEFNQANVGPSPFLYRTEYGAGITEYLPSGGNVAHVDQYLKVMGELGLEAATPIRLADGHEATLADVLRDSLAKYRPTQELEFTAVAYSRWLPPNREWRDREGVRHTLDELCLAMAAKPIGEGACAGAHAPYALANLIRAHRAVPCLSGRAVAAAEGRLREVSGLLDRHRLPGGGWYSAWHRSAAPDPVGDPTFQFVVATGHHLEWIAMAPPELRPQADTIRAAASHLAEMIPTHTANTIHNGYTTFTHAARALALLEEVDPSEVLRSTAPPGPR